MYCNDTACTKQGRAVTQMYDLVQRKADYKSALPSQNSLSVRKSCQLSDNSGAVFSGAASGLESDLVGSDICHRWSSQAASSAEPPHTSSKSKLLCITRSNTYKDELSVFGLCWRARACRDLLPFSSVTRRTEGARTCMCAQEKMGVIKSPLGLFVLLQRRSLTP